MGDLVLAFAFKASERIATEGGRQLTRVVPLAPPLQQWMAAQSARLAGQTPSVALEQELVASSVLPILGACLDSSLGVVDARDVASPLSPHTRLVGVQGVSGRFQLAHLFFAVCGPASFSGVEGDELLVSLVLTRTADADPDEMPTDVLLDRPPLDAAKALQWLGAFVAVVRPELGQAFLRLAGQLSSRHRCGFYAITVAAPRVNRPAQALADDVDFDRWRASHAGRAVIAVVSAYLLRCYVCAQRLERQLLAFEPGGDWDLESRRLLLARSRHLAFSRLAMTKNRALLGAPMLRFYSTALERLRLATLSADLGLLLGQCNDVLGGRNAYLDSSRLRTIEIVLFVASMLSLAIGLNAIQMPPFFDPTTTNALTRLEFWFVVTGTLGLFILMWGSINGWRHTRRLMRWAKRTLARS